MRNKIKTFLKDKKKEIIMIGAVLTTACIGGYIGANTGKSLCAISYKFNWS